MKAVTGAGRGSPPVTPHLTGPPPRGASSFRLSLRTAACDRRYRRDTSQVHQGSPRYPPEIAPTSRPHIAPARPQPRPPNNQGLVLCLARDIHVRLSIP